MMGRKPLGRKKSLALRRQGLAALLADVRQLIAEARAGVARAVDAGLTTLYWHVGQRIRQDILKQKRAGYGEQIVSALSAQLEQEFGRGFGTRNLFRMVRFAEVFPDPKIVSALRTQLDWEIGRGTGRIPFPMGSWYTQFRSECVGARGESLLCKS